MCASVGAEVVFGVHQETFGFGFELHELPKRHRCPSTHTHPSHNSSMKQVEKMTNTWESLPSSEEVTCTLSDHRRIVKVYSSFALSPSSIKGQNFLSLSLA